MLSPKEKSGQIAWKLVGMVCQCGTHSNVRAKYGEVAILIESFKYYLIDYQQTKEGSQFAPSRGVEGMSKLNNGMADAHWIQIQ